MATYIALAIGGVLGVYARYGLTRLIQSLYGQGFPLATLTVNLLGTFLLAFLFVLTLERVTISPAVRTGIMTGGLGAFTTFSTFIMEALILIEDGQAGKAALYLALSVGLGVAVAFGAVYIARNF
jgi:CrcB protein